MFHLMRYHGLQTVVSKAVDAFGSVKGRSCTASLGRINAGIPLLRTNGGIEDCIVGGIGRSFLSWLWRGEDGGEGNLFVKHALGSVSDAFAPTAGEMAGKLGSGAWLCCWRVSNSSPGGWWGSFCFWQDDAKCDRSCARTGTVMLSAAMRKWDTLEAHSLNPARYFDMASSVKYLKRDDVISIIFQVFDTSIIFGMSKLRAGGIVEFTGIQVLHAKMAP